MNTETKDIPALIELKRTNEKKISDLVEENRRLDIVISDGYLDYLREQFSKSEDLYLYCCSSLGWDEFYHVGEFKYFSFLGEKDKKRLPNYANDYEAYFDFIDGFTKDLKQIAENNLSVEIVKENPHFELNTHIKDGVVRFKWCKIVSKGFFETERQKLLKEVGKYSKASYGEYNCGDNIEYANKRGIFTGKILMIRGKSAFLSDGERVLLSTPRVKKIQEQ